MLNYLAGCATPILLLGLYGAWVNFCEWLETRRYQRAYEKFGDEFDRLTPTELKGWKRLWDDNPHNYARYDTDRARYFAARWKNGRTDEV